MVRLFYDRKIENAREERSKIEMHEKERIELRFQDEKNEMSRKDEDRLRSTKSRAKKRNTKQTNQ